MANFIFESFAYFQIYILILAFLLMIQLYKEYIMNLKGCKVFGSSLIPFIIKV